MYRIRIFCGPDSLVRTFSKAKYCGAFSGAIVYVGCAMDKDMLRYTVVGTSIHRNFFLLNVGWV
jgi:hypothetical protein